MAHDTCAMPDIAIQHVEALNCSLGRLDARRRTQGEGVKADVLQADWCERAASDDATRVKVVRRSRHLCRLAL
eukprot:15482453-Alexandrium_andersonii.AAC.1